MKQTFFPIIASAMVSVSATAASAEINLIWEGMYVEAGGHHVFRQFLERGEKYQVDLSGWSPEGDLDFEVWGQNQFGQMVKIVQRKSNHNYEFVQFTAPYTGYFTVVVENWNKPTHEYYDLAFFQVSW